MTVVLIFVGVGGAGKTTLLERLRPNRTVKVLQPSTTRAPRPKETDQYHFLKPTSWKKNNFAWAIEARGHHYGMRNSEIEELQPYETGITVFHPGNIDILNTYRQEAQVEIITVGLDTVKNHSDLKVRTNNDPARDEGEEAFHEQREIVCDCDVVFEGDAESVYKAVECLIRVVQRSGILDSSCIAHFIKAGSLLTSTSQPNVQPASYDLRVGTTVWCKGKATTLQANAVFSIPPYSYVIVQAQEEARLPKFIAAHYDVKVSLFVQGIILSNGPQVDPGYKGVLLCLLFNGSDADVGLKQGEHFATIEFQTTTKVTDGYAAHHQGMKSLQDFMQSSTAVSKGGTIIDKFEKLEGSWNTFRNIFAVAGISVIIAVAAFSATLFIWISNTADRASQSVKQAETLTPDLKLLTEKQNQLEVGLSNALQQVTNLNARLMRSDTPQASGKSLEAPSTPKGDAQ